MEIARDSNNIPFIKKKKQEDIIKEMANLSTLVEDMEKLFEETARQINTRLDELEQKVIEMETPKESKKSKS